MIIYLCIKFESNTLIFSKDIERKPFFKLKKSHNSKIIGGFYPKSNLTSFYDYKPLYKISSQYTNLFKRYRTETICVPYETDERTDSGGSICPTLSIENGGGIIYIIGGFYPKSNLTSLYDYIPLYKISIQYTNLFKRYRTETICVPYGTDERTDSGGSICPTPHIYISEDTQEMPQSRSTAFPRHPKKKRGRTIASTNK